MPRSFTAFPPAWIAAIAKAMARRPDKVAPANYSVFFDENIWKNHASSCRFDKCQATPDKVENKALADDGEAACSVAL